MEKNYARGCGAVAGKSPDGDATQDLFRFAGPFGVWLHRIPPAMAATLATLDAQDPEREVLSLPGFKMSSEMDLVGSLKEMGIGDAFIKRAADFSGIGHSPGMVSICGVAHKPVIKVNEQGAEAAAATAVRMQPESPHRKCLANWCGTSGNGVAGRRDCLPKMSA